jgi:hypothetical protein
LWTTQPQRSSQPRGRNGVGVVGDLLRPNGELVITSRMQLAQQAARHS